MRAAAPVLRGHRCRALLQIRWLAAVAERPTAEFALVELNRRKAATQHESERLTTQAGVAETLCNT